MTVLWSFRLSCKLKDVLWNTDSLLKNFQLYQTSAKNMLYTWIRAEHTHIVGIWRDAHILEIEWGGRSHMVEQVTTGIIRPTIHNLGNFCGLASTVLPYFNIGTFRSTTLSQWDMTICVQTCGLQAVHLEWVGGIGCCSDNGSVLLNVSLLWRAFGYCRLLWNLCCLFQLWSFFKSNYNISPYFPHHQHQNGKKSFTDGLQRSVLGMVPPPHLHSSRRSRKVEVEKKCTRYGCRLPAPL